MHVIRSLNDPLPGQTRDSVLAIGNFDGVHRGHQHVLARARALARRKGATFGVMSFEPHPRSFFAPDRPLFRLSPEPVKLQLFEAMGADYAVILPFGPRLAGMEPGAFLQEIVVDGLGAGHVVVGFDFHFGAGRRGSPDFLRAWGGERGLGVTVVEAREEGGEVISSSRIREALAWGDVATANRLLGYRWFVRGEVIHGDKRGRDLGYPTANMALPPETGLAHGIYGVRVLVDGRLHGGAASFGRRPQFDNGRVLLETYIFDFSGDLYGRDISIEFIARLRPEARFESVEALVAQMQRDCAAARQAIARAEGASILAGEAPGAG